jgi:uncharacterized protein (DUF1697 family)
MRWIAMVRNVMLGRDGLDRSALLAAVTSAGGSNPRSHLTTGNVSFESDLEGIDGLQEQLEARVSAIVSRPTMVAVRDADFMNRLLLADPFSDWDHEEWELEVAFLRHSGPVVDARRLPDPGRTRVVAVYEREIATARPRSGGNRPHVNTLLERATGAAATARGWSTLQRLARL